MKTTKLIAMAAVSAGLTLGATAQANSNSDYKSNSNSNTSTNTTTLTNETTVSMNSLPTAVQTTLQDKAGSHQIVKIEKGERNGKTVYEGIVNKNGQERAITVDKNGNFLNEHNEKSETNQNNPKY